MSKEPKMATRKTWLLISACFITGILVIVSLFFYEKINRSKNNDFSRLFPPHALTIEKDLNLKINSYYIAGQTKTRIYLGNYTVPAQVISMDYNLQNQQTIRLRIPEEPTMNVQTTLVKIDSPHVYMSDRLSTYLLQGELNGSLVNQGKLDRNQFSLSSPISNTSTILFTKDLVLNQMILTKTTRNRGDNPVKKYILEKQSEGSFSVQGMLHYNTQLNKIIFLYYYRNQFINLDTNLNVIYKSKTIDTNTIAKIKLKVISKEQIRTFSEPPLVVNKRSCISEKDLFVYAAIKADNQSEKDFDAAYTIDVYRLSDGKYRYSFYLPKFGGERLSSFSVHHHTLVAIYNHQLVTFKLNETMLR